MGIFWAWKIFFVMGNFWSCGKFIWDKFWIHLMRSCSTNLNLSWLAFYGVCTYKAELNAPSLEMNAWFFFFFLILKSWFLWKDDDGGPLFWKWMRHDQMPLVCKLMHDFWKPWYLRKIWFIFFFQNGRDMAEFP